MLLAKDKKRERERTTQRRRGDIFLHKGVGPYLIPTANDKYRAGPTLSSYL